DGHAQPDLAACRMRKQEKSCTAGTLAEDLVDGAEREADPPFGLGHVVVVERRCAVAGPVECDGRVSGGGGRAQQRELLVAGAVEVRGRGGAAVDGDDHGLRLRHRRDQCRHRYAVHKDDPWAWGHASVRRRIAPLGVSPPLLTTPTRASLTWRSPASPRSCTTASWIRPMPCVRPCESWPPWVFNGITPSRAMALPPSMKSLASPIPQKPRPSSHDRQLKV